MRTCASSVCPFSACSSTVASSKSLRRLQSSTSIERYRMRRHLTLLCLNRFGPAPHKLPSLLASRCAVRKPSGLQGVEPLPPCMGACVRMTMMGMTELVRH
eukprot:365651-Chlamydomonas_euryale.AAC.5